MGTRTKSFFSAVALGFGLLFFGPATSDAQAQHAGPAVEFRSQFPLPHGSIDVYASNAGHGGKRYGKHYRNRSSYRHHQPGYGYSRHHRRDYGHSYYRGHRPYRLVRVLVYDPYPRYVHRRVFYAPHFQHFEGDSCRPY